MEDGSGKFLFIDYLAILLNSALLLRTYLIAC